MGLISREEMAFGRKNVLGKFIAFTLMRIFKINKVNKMYASLEGYSREEFTSKFFERYDISYSVLPQQLQNIPKTGGVIVIANHPTGALDGVIFIDLLSKVRPDVKFLGNYLISRIEPLKDCFINVDPFNAKNGKNVNGIRTAMEYVANGGLLVLFPAGEVSTYQKGFSHLEDKEWPASMMKFIKKANVPVLPIYIESKNSRLFHLAGMIHPIIRTAMLPGELLNKEGTKVKLAIGSLLSPARLSDIKSIDVYSKYLRANVYLLKDSLYEDPIEPDDKEVFENIIPPVELSKLLSEIEELKVSHLLFQYTSYSLFCAPSDIMPNLMIEIARLREMTYRQIGEGTNNSSDRDHYDDHYHQLFIWDNENNKLVGAYRVGYGKEIVENYGLSGFYTNSLFKMSDMMKPVMSSTIELGRSFIIKEYQRKAVILMLLWKGIMYLLLKNENYRYLIGPVSISGEMQKISKMLIVNYIKKHHFDYSLAKNIKPITGLGDLDACIDPTYLEGIQDLEALDKIVLDIEHRRFGVPVLIKRYIQLGGSVIGFNVDHEFKDTLDSLLIVDLNHIPQQTLAMLSKELNIDVISRFRDN